jgi:hypothetical protein
MDLSRYAGLQACWRMGRNSAVWVLGCLGGHLMIDCTDALITHSLTHSWLHFFCSEVFLLSTASHAHWSDREDCTDCYQQHLSISRPADRHVKVTLAPLLCSHLLCSHLLCSHLLCCPLLSSALLCPDVFILFAESHHYSFISGEVLEITLRGAMTTCPTMTVDEEVATVHLDRSARSESLITETTE